MMNATEMALYSSLANLDPMSFSHAEKVEYNVYLSLPSIFSKMFNFSHKKKITWGWEYEDDAYMNSSQDWIEISERIMERLKSDGFKVSRTEDGKASIVIEW